MCGSVRKSSVLAVHDRFFVGSAPISVPKDLWSPSLWQVQTVHWSRWGDQSKLGKRADRLRVVLAERADILPTQTGSHAWHSCGLQVSFCLPSAVTRSLLGKAS